MKTNLEVTEINAAGMTLGAVTGLDAVTAEEALKILGNLEPEKTRKQVKAEMKKVVKQARAVVHAKTKLSGTLPLKRNSPCPCQSGKKLKHCCLRMGKDFQDALDAGVPPETIRTRHSLNQPLIQGET